MPQEAEVVFFDEFAMLVTRRVGARLAAGSGAHGGRRLVGARGYGQSLTGEVIGREDEPPGGVYR